MFEDCFAALAMTFFQPPSSQEVALGGPVLRGRVIARSAATRQSSAFTFFLEIYAKQSQVC